MIYPIGIQDFEKIRQQDCVYIDKTALVYQLVSGIGYYFLSRPRRFGKSLLISTMEAYFLGKKELFKGLAMEQLEQEWTVYPVLHLDLNASEYKKENDLYEELNRNLLRWESIYDKGEGEVSPSLRFAGVIERACEKTGQKVVILIDEYDKPLLNTIGNPELQDHFRSQMKAFYSVMKTQDRYIKLGFITGVTRFSKVSNFSDLNNFTDISMDPRYVEICGITEKEIHDNLDAEVEELAIANDLTKEECYAQLKDYYDGYHFRQNSVGIYNPFSLLNTLSSKVFSDYWFETGTPTFLVELLKKTNYNLNELVENEATTSTLSDIGNMDRNPISVIYQSGYLTIKGYDKRFESYLLGFPNREVEKGFTRYLSKSFTKMDNTSAFDVKKFVIELEAGEVEAFMRRLEALFADNDYRVQGSQELYFQNVLYVFFKLLGFFVEVERPTSEGRMDMIVKTSDYIYIFEFKLDKNADEALQQIEDKGYALPYAADPRRLFKIGVNFTSEHRRVAEWKVVER
ncbi:MAG: ATP-binding protein [Bacteroidaceae bacterium]|nr:ATP-binding protein [Bacteroidaceae bacterium]